MSIVRIGQRAPTGSGELLDWCRLPQPTKSRSMPSAGARDELQGYVAAIAFLLAYALLAAAAAPVVRAVLNLTGSILAARYLWYRRALPNVLLNVAWAAITIAGLFSLLL